MTMKHFFSIKILKISDNICEKFLTEKQLSLSDISVEVPMKIINSINFQMLISTLDVRGMQR